MNSSTTGRLPRLLALIPYLIARPGIRVDDAAADFGITPEQLRMDLELLWMCGLPGYGPGDLIDLSFQGDIITVTYDAGMRRPLRLTGVEATALLVALRALANTPGVTDTDAVRRTLAKVEAAAGAAQPAGVVIDLAAGDTEATKQVGQAVQDALRRKRAARIRYYTASRDRSTNRTIDPMRVLLTEGHGYVEAWCRTASAVRLFRLDRIDSIIVLDEPATPPADAKPVNASAGLFQPQPDQHTATLLLAPDARWIAEYYLVDELIELEGGYAKVVMRYADTAWMIRLILGTGGQAVVQQPAELAAQVRARALTALQGIQISGAQPSLLTSTAKVCR